MPQQNAQPEITQEQVAKFHSLTPEQRQTAISRMTPELKQRFIPAALEYKAMHAPDTAYPQPTPAQPQPQGIGKIVDPVASFTTRNAPTISGAVGGVLGGMAGGLPGGVAGAAAGGAYGAAVKSHAEEGKVSAKEVGKEAATQGGLELFGGLAGKGIAKAAELLGVKEAMMKFALNRGEDFSRDMNPAAAMNKYQLHARTTKELWNVTNQKIGSLNKVGDAMLDEVAPYSSTVRPYAVAKGVIDGYKRDALKVGDDNIADTMTKMLDNLGHEFNNASTGAQGLARQQGMSSAAAAAKFPTDKLMTTQEANALKRTWGESVQWGKEPPKDSLQAAYKAVQNARRDIYHALNDSISDAMGGNQGRQWRATNRDIFQLMEAKGALQEAGERRAGEAKELIPKVLDAMRRPGPLSTAAQAVPTTGLGVGQAAANVGRGLTVGQQEFFGSQK